MEMLENSLGANVRHALEEVGMGYKWPHPEDSRCGYSCRHTRKQRSLENHRESILYKVCQRAGASDTTVLIFMLLIVLHTQLTRAIQNQTCHVLSSQTYP